MDRFTHELKGEKEETIERQSVESAATMTFPVTVKKLGLIFTYHNHFHLIFFQYLCSYREEKCSD